MLRSRIVDATLRGVALVHQEITINRSLNIAENIFIGNLRSYARPLGIMKRKQMATVAQAALDRIGVDISVSTSIDRLNLGELKCIEIARAISSNPNTLLLDESTAYLDHRGSRCGAPCHAGAEVSGHDDWLRLASS